jgi:RNA polymerase sigma factor (sigma-70 family)
MSKSKFCTLYESYHDEMEVFARQRLGREDARDVVHEVYLRLLKHADHDSLENPRAYLYRITTNVINDFGDSLKKRRFREEMAELCESSGDASGNPEVTAMTNQMLQQCLATLDELPVIYRRVFLLNRVDGIPQTEIASTLKLPLRTVERYISKALAHCLNNVNR